MNPTLLILKALWVKYRLVWVSGIITTLMGIASYTTARYKDGQYALKEQKINVRYLEDIQRQHEEYEGKLKALTEEALRKQQALSELNTQTEQKYHDAQKKLQDASSKYDRLVRDGFRLRDRHAQTSPVQVCRGTQGQTSTTANGSNDGGGGELSEEASRRLWGYAEDADRLANQLKALQEYTKELHKQCGG